MKFDKRKDINPKYLLLMCTIICIGLIFASYFAADEVAAVKNITVKIITPIQNGINHIGLWTDSKIDNLKKIEDLQAENDALRAELETYKNDINQLQNRQNELSELQKLYELDEQYPDYNKTAANVFAKDASSWFAVFYIDKGQNDGLFEGANVMCGGGLAGIITECHDDYARVRAVIDDDSNVSARVMPSNALCTVKGNLNQYENGYLIAENIDKDASVSVGDKVVTSTISDRYHPGLIIGYVSRIEDDPNNLTRTAYITPAVDFNNISNVLIITDRKKSVQE
ncbi:MAG: rod shape-determining protein MreC [Wujia sp.]